MKPPNVPATGGLGLADRGSDRVDAIIGTRAKFVKHPKHAASIKQKCLTLQAPGDSPTQTHIGETVKLTLGQYLASIRLDRKMSLRQVEEASGKEVSNAYVSQLENEKILQPSPTVLHTLAGIYDIDYITLMQLAGYLPDTTSRSADERHGRVATFAEHNLTQDEESELMEYLQFLRTKKKQ